MIPAICADIEHEFGKSGRVATWMHYRLNPKAKENGRRRLFYNGLDNYIFTRFIRYYLNHDIIVFLLPHLSQSLDVVIFDPLKSAMSSQLSQLNAMEILRLQKVEWLEHYIISRSKLSLPKTFSPDEGVPASFPEILILLSINFHQHTSTAI